MVTRTNDDRAARESFANIVVCFAVKFQLESIGQECAKTLAGGAAEFVNRGRRRRVLYAGAHVLAAQVAANAAMKIIDERGTRARRLRLPEHFGAAGFRYGRLLWNHAGRMGHRDHQERIESRLRFEAIIPAAQLGERTHAELRHVASSLLGKRTEVTYDHFRLSVEPQT